MKTKSILVVVILLASVSVCSVEAITIGFEELGPVGADIPLPTDYLGFSWIHFGNTMIGCSGHLILKAVVRYAYGEDIGLILVKM